MGDCKSRNLQLDQNQWQGRITEQTYDSSDRNTAIRPPEATGSAIIQYVHYKAKHKLFGEYIAFSTTHHLKREKKSSLHEWK